MTFQTDNSVLKMIKIWVKETSTKIVLETLPALQHLLFIIIIIVYKTVSMITTYLEHVAFTVSTESNITSQADFTTKMFSLNETMALLVGAVLYCT